MLRRCLLLALALLGATAAPAAAVTVTSPTAAEGQPLQFALEGAPLEAVTLSVRADSTAGAGDYTAPDQQVVLGLSGTATVTVATTQDDLPERDETVNLTADGAVSDPQTGTGTITDSDPPVLAPFDARATENAGGVDIIVARTPVSRPTRLTWSVSGGSATAGADFEGSGGELTVPANGDQARFRLALTDDTADEDEETVTVSIASSEGTVARANATVTIADDDQRTLTVADTPTVEGDGSDTLVRVPLTLSAVTFRPVTVQYATANLTARSGEDYTARQGSITIPPGQTQAFIDVPIRADDRVEPAEQLALYVGRETGAKVTDGFAVVAIADDDAAAGDETPPDVRVTKPRRSGRALSVRVTCPRGERRCAGRVTFFSQADRRSRVKSLRRERRIGRKAFRLAGGRSATVKLTLPRSVARAARRAGRLKVRAYVVTEDANANTDTTSASATVRFRR